MSWAAEEVLGRDGCLKIEIGLEEELRGMETIKGGLGREGCLKIEMGLKGEFREGCVKMEGVLHWELRVMGHVEGMSRRVGSRTGVSNGTDTTGMGAGR